MKHKRKIKRTYDWLWVMILSAIIGGVTTFALFHFVGPDDTRFPDCEANVVSTCP